MNKALIISALILITIVIARLLPGNQKSNIDKKIRPSGTFKPTKLIDNDKVIIVKNLSLDYIKKAIEQFCNNYNQQQFIAIPRLDVFETKYFITFPYDIDFERFCYFVNYIKYANELSLKPDYKPEVLAWCSTKKNDLWMTEDIVNKRVMIFIPDWDKDYDNVYLTTEDNIGFKMGFALGESHIKLNKSVLEFQNPPTELFETKSTQTIDFD